MKRCVVVVAAAAAALVLAGCGDGGDDAFDDPVDLAREQVAAQAGAASVATTRAATPNATSGDEPDDPGPVAELPPPDPLTFVGRHRVINAWVGAGGTTQVLDVWARRTLTTGPVLLAENVGFGTASDYLAVPPGHQIVVVGGGAGPDGIALAELVALADREQATTIITAHDATGTVDAMTVWEVDPDGSDPTPAPPADGTGLVVVRAVNTTAFETPLTLEFGSASFLVGVGGDSDCAHQRVEDSGFAPVVLGGGQPVEIELAPGGHVITLHPATATPGCGRPSVLDVPIEVAAGASTMVLIVSRDGRSLEASAYPIVTG